MKFGDVYQFKYSGKSRGTDRNPRIVFFGETEDKIIGVNLNYLRMEAQTGVMSIVNHQMIRENPLDETALNTIVARQNKLDDEKIARILMLANMDDDERDDDKEEEEEEESKKIESEEMSKHQAINLMSKALRVYSKQGIQNFRKTGY
jgi:hypothetical protein